MSKKQDINSIINSRLSYLKTNKSLAQNVTKQKTSKRAKKAPYKVAVIICLCFLVAVPVMASKIPSFSRLLSVVAEPIAQMLRPIEMIAIDNGIKMEVVGAYSDGETAVAYLTLTELTNLKRIDDSVDMYNYFFTGYSSFRQDFIGYNENLKTATIMLLANGKDSTNKKTTFLLQSFLSNKEHFNIDLQSILMKSELNEVQTIELDSDSCPGGGGKAIKELYEKGSFTILKPHQQVSGIKGIDFVEISNIGFINNRLHVQTKWAESINNHGFLYLVDEQGNKIYSGNLSFNIDNNEKPVYGSRYTEYVFDISKDKISKYRLLGELTKNNKYTEGSWETTFKIEPIKEFKVINDVTVKDFNIKELSITPIGVNIKTDDTKDMDLKIVMKDKTIMNEFSIITNQDDREVKIKYLYSKPININDIKEIYINDTLINLN